MPRLIPFEPDHIWAFYDRDNMGADTLRLALEKAQGIAYTAVEGDEILGCAGLVLMPWQGVGEVWMTLGKKIERYPVWLTRTCRRVIADWRRAYKLHRIGATVLVGQHSYVRWLEAIGFALEKDGIARSLGPGGQDLLRLELVGEP